MNNIIAAHWKSFKQKITDRTEWQVCQRHNKNRLLVLGILVFVCGIFYLWQINSLATKGYQIKELEEKVSDLKDNNKKLQVQITELRSVSRINEEVKRLNMQEVARIEYLSANGSVALNR
ncbi:MAG: hypothetical protein NTZ49_04860 [Candidatus Parcubacteria bacterium]|nr:hypothetical protein [Candidatus Parcubacteria bacterium]